MSDFARQLCNELMGLDRNKLSHETKTKEKKFYDKDVCKYYLVSFCPHELFLNTKSDIGSCEYFIHDEALRADFMLNGDEYKLAYERKMTDYLQKLVNDLDRKTRRAKERLETKPSEGVLAMMNPNKDENEEKIVRLELQLRGILEKMEACGEEGKIQEAQQLDVEAEKIRKEIDRIKQEMEVCETCGAFLVVNDAAKRLDAHFEGKQHTGYEKVRNELKRLQEKLAQLDHDRPHPEHERPLLPASVSKRHDSQRSSKSAYYDWDRYPYDDRKARDERPRDNRREHRRSRSPSRRR